MLVWSPLAGGLLSGKYRRDRDAPAGSRQLSDRGQPPVRDQEALWKIVDVLVEIGDRTASRPRRWRSPGCSGARA